MTEKDAIKTIELAMRRVEWDYPLDFAAAFDVALKNIKAVEKIKSLVNNSELTDEQILARITKAIA